MTLMMWSNTDNKKNEEDSSNNNINREEVGGKDVDDSKTFICDILKDVISSSRAEKDVLDIFFSNFSHFLFIDLRPRSEFSLSLDQNLHDQILHEVFDKIDDDYVTDFFNADHGHQEWCEAVQSIVICDEDSELLKNTNVKAFSLDSLNPLRDVSTLERPHLNQLIHPLIDCSLWIFAKINYISSKIPLQGKIRTNADGVGFLNDVLNYQIVCMEGAKPEAKNKKIDDDDKKNIRNMA
ncbi:hypothetical protein C1645_822233 [Glomus cerebriforme]|uniref:Uncharacterized protein n=1 Tax=Glomus cerebriforme TaxID=658196 RepID=A0A397T8L8_9GLOM|nr:hypothetical protein C1645_822233 [Glomus cerebriforme]